jgi:hypothetical protein
MCGDDFFISHIEAIKMRIRKTIFLLTLLMLVNVELVSAEQGKLIHNGWNPPGVMLGVTKNDISLKNDVKLCQPVPTDDTSKGVKWNWCNIDFTYSLQQTDPNSAQYFPLNDLPSGGNSGRISPSEMVIAVVNLLVNDPVGGYVQYSWYKKSADVGGADKLLVQTEKLPVLACGGYPHFGSECGMYGSVIQYSYIGHFSGEIEEGGYYYVIVATTWGQARIDFGVVPIVNGATGDGILTIVTPVPKVTSVTTSAVTPVVTTTPAATSDSYAYRTGSWIGSGTEKFLSGMLHGFWNELGF